MHVGIILSNLHTDMFTENYHAGEGIVVVSKALNIAQITVRSIIKMEKTWHGCKSSLSRPVREETKWSVSTQKQLHG